MKNSNPRKYWQILNNKQNSKNEASIEGLYNIQCFQRCK